MTRLLFSKVINKIYCRITPIPITIGTLKGALAAVKSEQTVHLLTNKAPIIMIVLTQSPL